MGHIRSAIYQLSANSSRETSSFPFIIVATPKVVIAEMLVAESEHRSACQRPSASLKKAVASGSAL